MMKLVVLSCVLVAASASGVFAPYAPLVYSAPYGLAPYNYRGPLSLAPGQPANVLGLDGRPLDTLDVNLDRAAHLTAKAFDNGGIHLLKKRSAPLSLLSPYSAIAYSAPLLQPYNYRGPLSLAPGQPANILGLDGRPLDTLEVNLDRSAHLTAKSLGNAFHILKKRSALIAPVYGSRIAYTHTPLITPAVPIARISPFSPVTHLGTPVFTHW